MHIRRALAGAVIAVAVVTAACSSGGEEQKVPDDAQRVTVTLGDPLKFEPTSLSVQAGHPVRLTVKNTSNSDHDFYIMGMPAREVVSRNDTGHVHGEGEVIFGHPKTKGEVTINFTPTEPGTYQFFCSLPGHREAGMMGTITVS